MVENTGGNAEKQTRQKPKNMGQTKGLKTHPFRYILTGYKKHIYHPEVLYHITTKNASVKIQIKKFLVKDE